MSVENIIKASFDQDPTAVAGAFNAAIKDKLMNAIEARRDQIAQKMYGSEDNVEPDNSDNSDTEEDQDENT